MRLHARDGVRTGKEGAEQVGVDGASYVGFGVEPRVVDVQDAGVVVESVDLAEGVDAGVDECFGDGPIADIAIEHLDVAAGR